MQGLKEVLVIDAKSLKFMANRQESMFHFIIIMETEDHNY